MRELIAILVILIAAPLYALTEAEYENLIRTWPAFAKADRELGEAWKANTNSLNKNDKDYILKNQREWIKSGRNQDARELMADGTSQRCAYLLATMQRTAFLKAYGYNMNLPQEDQDAGRVKADDFFFDYDAVPEECAK